MRRGEVLLSLPSVAISDSVAVIGVRALGLFDLDQLAPLGGAPPLEAGAEPAELARQTMALLADTLRIRPDETPRLNDPAKSIADAHVSCVIAYSRDLFSAFTSIR